MAKYELPERFADLFTSPGMQEWACLGAVTDRSVRVWVRSLGGRRVSATINVDEQTVAGGEIDCLDERDGIGVSEIEAPAEFAGSDFQVEVVGKTLRGRFAPAAGTPSTFAFVFGSCNQPFQRGDDRAEPSPTGEIYEPMQSIAARAEARFNLLIGDQAYADGIRGLNVPDWAREHPNANSEELLAAYRQLYRAYFGHAGFASLLEARPSYLIWDDHEIFDCWGSHESISDIERRLFETARVAYREYQHVHNPGTSFADSPPFDYQFWYGNTGFFVFDLRGERDYNSGRLISEEQWSRFEAFLAEASERNIPTIFVGTSIPVVHFSPRGIRWLDGLPMRKAALARERWDSEAFLPHRERLLEMLFTWQASRAGRGVFLLSGDVHAAAAFRVHKKNGPGVITQWTSSALSTPSGLEHVIANRVGAKLVNYGETMCRSELIGIEPKNNFGLVEVEPRADGQGHSVKLSIYKFDPKKRKLTPSIADQT
jgi:PhoD-like phosphatase